MDEARKRVLAIVAGIIVARHLKTADDLFGGPQGSPRTDKMITAAVQWAVRIMQKTDTAYLDICLNHYREARKGLDDLATGKPGQRPIHPQYVAKILNEVAADDAIFTVDVGTPVIWVGDS